MHEDCNVSDLPFITSLLLSSTVRSRWRWLSHLVDSLGAPSVNSVAFKG